MPFTHNDCLPVMGVSVEVIAPCDTTGLASAFTPVSVLLALMAAAKARPLEAGSLLETTVFENLSSLAVVGRILTPLISKSSMPRLRKSATRFSVTSVAEAEMVAPELAVAVMVNATPGVRAAKRISPTSRPLVAYTPKVLLALMLVIKLSTMNCGVF